MRIAIHQPNFFPWLGLFHRIAQVDVFVFFDHVQAVRGKSWFTRNKILVGGEPKWLTLPVYRSGCGKQAIREVRVNYEGKFVHKHLRTLELNYGKAPHFREEFDWIVALYEQHYNLAAEFNIEFAKLMIQRLGYGNRFVLSSDLVRENSSLEDARGNDLVLGICKAVGAMEYLSGTGCLDFIRPETFEESGIRFAFQEFAHPEYPQASSSFHPNLSVLDALFSIGSKALGRLLSPDVL